MVSAGQVLNEQQAALRARERQILSALASRMESFGAAADDVAMLRQALLDLDAMFLLVIVGEFNAGKSSFINALLGERVLEEGVTPTTSVINLLRYGATATAEVREEFLVERLYPSPFLREISIVDTPGTNAIIRRHEEITNRFAPRSDLVLFVTSADRPFTESERAFLERLRAWGKKIVVVLNKADLLGHDEVETVLTFIRQHTQALLGFTPDIFPVSARQALRAKGLPEGKERAVELEESGFDRLEGYITRTLDEESRVRLKLLNPLGIAEGLTARYLRAAQERLDLLRDDLVAMANIDGQLETFRGDMQREVEPRIATVEKVVYEMGNRGTQYFEDTVRLGRLFDLLNSDRLRGEFTRVVLADSTEQIDGRAQDLIDWMVNQELRLWQGVMDYVARRRQAATDGLIGQVGGSFDHDRRELLGTVTRAVRGAVESFDRQAEAAKLAEEMRATFTRTALVEAGAVGLGAGIALLVGTVAADFTGILAAGVMAGLGFYIIPARRRRAQREFTARMAQLREQLTAAMREQFTRELARSIERIRDAIGPYGRFVRSESERFERYRADFSGTDDELGRLRAAIET